VHAQSGEVGTKHRAKLNMGKATGSSQKGTWDHSLSRAFDCASVSPSMMHGWPFISCALFLSLFLSVLVKMLSILLKNCSLCRGPEGICCSLCSLQAQIRV
jgi:hypothetical protein